MNLFQGRNLFYSIVVIIVMILLIITGLNYCHSPKNQLLALNDTARQLQRRIIINDSIHAEQQKVLIAQTRADLLRTQDSMQLLINKAAKVTPEIIIKYIEDIKIRNQIGSYENTIKKLEGEIAYRRKVVDSFEYYKDRIVLAPFQIKAGNDWFNLRGTIQEKGIFVLDSLDLTKAPYITIGESGKWYQRKTINVVVGDRNPYTNQTSLQSYRYIPKQKHIGMTFGPMAGFSNKGFVYGVGVTAGWTLSIK